MKTDSPDQSKIQSDTIAAIAARCEGPHEFENFDRMFRHSLTIPKAAVVKEEARLKRLRTRKRAKKTHG